MEGDDGSKIQRSAVWKGTIGVPAIDGLQDPPMECNRCPQFDMFQARDQTCTEMFSRLEGEEAHELADGALNITVKAKQALLEVMR